MGSKIIGIGGVTVTPDGTKAAFLQLSMEDAERFPITLHKTALQFIGELEASGVRRIVAICDEARPAAGRWLERLGFKPSGTVEGESIYLWQHSQV